MKKIPLSVTRKQKYYKSKLFALVDDEDYESISKHFWYYSDGYARTTLPEVNGKKKHISMHRMLLGLTDSKVKTDHKDHNRINNQRYNIRACTHQENLMNKSPWGRSKYLGVSYKISIINKRQYSYIYAGIKVNGKRKYLGSYKSEEDAAKAYDTAAKLYYGEFANLNFP